MGAQLYSASASPLVVAKGSTTPIRIKAYAMTAQQWRLEVKKQGSTAVVRSFEGSAAKDGLIDQSWDLKDSSGTKVSAGVYTLTLQSWSGSTVAVPYAVNVSLFADPNVLARPADGVFHLEGRGYGHGHGMSQFGAEGAARQGLTPAQILAFYYPGHDACDGDANSHHQGLPGGRRPGIRLAPPDIRLRPATGLQVTEGAKTLLLPAKLGGRASRSGARTSPAGRWVCTAGPGRPTTRSPAGPGVPARSVSRRRRPPRRPRGSTCSTPTKKDVVYRGVIEARRSAANDKLFAVSEVLLDDYVKSVVSAEMPGGWTDTAYRAQAVAARSYGPVEEEAAQVTAGNAWDICDTTSCQVYNGYTGETSPESKAATATSLASTSAMTASRSSRSSAPPTAGDRDGGKPYLVAKADPYDGVVTGSANWGHSWTRTSRRRPSRRPTRRRQPRAHRHPRPHRPRRVGRPGDLRTPRGLQDRRDGERYVAAQRPRAEERVVPGRARGAGPAARRHPERTTRGPPGRHPAAVRTVRRASVTASRGAWAAPSSNGASASTGYRVTVSPGGRVIDLPATTEFPSTVDASSSTAGRLPVSVVAKSASGSSTQRPRRA